MFASYHSFSGDRKHHLTYFVCPDNNNEVDDQPVTALEEDVHLEPTETTYQPEEEAEQSTGASLKITFIQQNMSKTLTILF